MPDPRSGSTRNDHALGGPGLFDRGAAAFHRDVIAEGVETAAHGQMLLAIGCDLAQGYGIARPMPAQDMPSWAAHWRPDASWSVAA